MSSFSASGYTSVPVKVPMSDAWGYLNLSTVNSPVLTDGANVNTTVSRLQTGAFGVTFSSSSRFSSNAYVVITTPEYSDDSTYAPVSCRIGNPSGSTALGRSAGFEINTFRYSSGFHVGGGTAFFADPASNTLKVGFAAFSFSRNNNPYVPTNTPENKFPTPNDIFAWYGERFGSVGNSSVISRDSVPSPVGNTPLRMNITGGNPYILSNNESRWNISPASKGQRWKLKVFVKGSRPMSGAQIYIFGARSDGVALLGSGAWVNIGVENISVTTEWREVSLVFTFTNPDVAFIQVRLDGPDSGAEGETIWWDGLQVYEETSDYSTVPGASGFGVTGATYNSHLTNLLSKRTATAYGTLVIPPARGTGTPVSAYIENSFNIQGVSAGGLGVFDVTFVKPMNSTDYCVILSGEYESNFLGVVATDLSTATEFSDLLVRAGAGNQFKTTSRFRIESRKQTAASGSDNSWAPRGNVFRNGRTERIHFMVFGGGTYGQP